MAVGGKALLGTRAEEARASKTDKSAATKRSPFFKTRTRVRVGVEEARVEQL